MKKETWDFLKFSLKLGVKFAPRIAVAPYVGAVRGVMAVQDRICAEVTAFSDNQRKAQQESRSSERAPG